MSQSKMAEKKKIYLPLWLIYAENPLLLQVFCDTQDSQKRSEKF